MDKFIKQLSERLADQSSRRGFLSKIGKAVIGAAVLITGQEFFSQAAEAATTLHCCTGNACPHSYCPQGSRVTYTWHCGHPAGGGYYICHDCHKYTTNHLVCVFATYHA